MSQPKSTVVDKNGDARLADDLENSVNSPDVGQEVVSESGTGRGTLGQTGDIDASEDGRNLGRGLVQVAEPVESSCRERKRTMSIKGRSGHQRIPKNRDAQSGTGTRVSSGSIVALLGETN